MRVRDYLKRVSFKEAQETMALIERNKVIRTIHRFHRNGFSNDREKSGRNSASTPLWVLFHPEYGKYFSPEIRQREDRRREAEKFFKLDTIVMRNGQKISPKGFMKVDRF